MSQLSWMRSIESESEAWKRDLLCGIKEILKSIILKLIQEEK